MNDMDKCPDSIGAKQTIVYTLPAELACMVPSEREFATMVSLAAEIVESMDTDAWSDLMDIMQSALCILIDEDDEEQDCEIKMECMVDTSESGRIGMVIPFAGGFTEEELDAIVESMPNMVRNVIQDHYGKTVMGDAKLDAEFIAAVRNWYLKQNDWECSLFIGVDVSKEDAMAAAVRAGCSGVICISTCDDDDNVVEMPDVDQSSFEDEFTQMMDNIVKFVTNYQNRAPKSDATLDFEVVHLDGCALMATVDLNALDGVEREEAYSRITNTADAMICAVANNLECVYYNGSGNITSPAVIDELRRKIAWSICMEWEDGASSVDVAFPWVTPDGYTSDMLTAVELRNGEVVHERPFCVIPIWKYLDLFTGPVNWDTVSSLTEWNSLRLYWLMDHGFTGNCVDEVMRLDRELMARMPFHTEMYNDLVRNMEWYMDLSK